MSVSDSALHVQTRFAQLRYVSYIGVQIVGLLTPLLVYHLTHSLTLAGVALLAEWLPKLAMYFLGGTLVQSLSTRKCLAYLNIIRLLAFILLLVCAAGHGSIQLTALAAALFQCANAVSNVLFETAVTHWWSPALRASGHARLLKCDQLGCVTALAFGLMTGNTLLLCFAGLAVQIVCLLLVANLWPHLADSQTEQDFSLSSVWSQIACDFSAVRKRELITFSSVSMLITIPVCSLFSMAAFYLGQAAPEMADGTQLLSFVLLAKTLLGTGILGWLQKKLQSQASHHAHIENRTGLAGMLIVLLGTVLAAQQLTLVPAILAMLAISSGWVLYQPWMRAVRQEMIVRTVPAPSRAGVTGILISVEAASYLAGGGILIATHENLHLALLTGAALATLGMIWRFYQLPQVMAKATVTH